MNNLKYINYFLTNMEEDEINQRMSNEFNDEAYDSQDNYNIHEKTEFITFNVDENNISNDKYNYNPSNEISPIKISNTVNTRPYRSIENFHQNRISNYNRYTYNNYNKNKYSNLSMPINVVRNDNNYINRKTYVNNSQDFSQLLYNTKANYYNKYNKSQIYNGNTTDDCDSYINPNRDSAYYNSQNENQNQKMYLTTPINYNLEEQTNNNNDYTEDEQLIIYPEKQYIFLNEKLFNKKSKEGLLRPKNLETYEIKSIEYIPDDEYKYKSISLGDYILKRNKLKSRKTKSCSNVNNIKDESDKEYQIKNFINKKKDKKNLVQSDILYNIKTLKEKYNNKNTEKKINNINIIKKSYENSDVNYQSSEIDKNKGGIVDLSDKKSLTNKYWILKYPKWKIVASACLIQSWFRSLKRLKLLYKKNLHKIIIIQKVYKMHYKYKILSNRQKPNIYKNYIEETKEDYKNIYRAKRPKKYLDKYNKQVMTKYKKTVPIVYNSGSDDNNFRKNNFRIYNKQNITSKINTKYTYQENLTKNRTYFVSNNSCYVDNLLSIAVLLMEKIIENKILKIYFDFIFRLKNYNKNETKSDSGLKKDIKLLLKPKKHLKINKNKIKISENKVTKKKIEQKEEIIDTNMIIINDEKKYNFTLKQKFLLKKLFLRIWFRQAMALKNAKRTKRKDRFYRNKNKHILFKNLCKFVLETIKQEVKRKKLISFWNIINEEKNPNLKYAFKKIKKFAKVKYNVLNNYASIIQNAFRYYLENKNKEEK